jgi:uncharacterized protein YbaR (Trm112 family)
MSGRIDPELLAVLVCPKCESELVVRRAQDGEEQSLDCTSCRLSYPVEDGIPVMLAEEARPLPAAPRAG